MNRYHFKMAINSDRMTDTGYDPEEGLGNVLNVNLTHD